MEGIGSGTWGAWSSNKDTQSVRVAGLLKV